jgi:hypothetical protein
MSEEHRLGWLLAGHPLCTELPVGPKFPLVYSSLVQTLETLKVWDRVLLSLDIPQPILLSRSPTPPPPLPTWPSECGAVPAGRREV